MTNEQWQEQYDAIAPTWEWYRTHAIHPNDPMMVGYLKEVWDKFSCGLAAYIQFYLQPPLMDLPYHYDGRSTNINFVYPHEEVSPLTIEGKDFYYDNFVFDGGYQKHMVRGSASPRFMMQICFLGKYLTIKWYKNLETESCVNVVNVATVRVANKEAKWHTQKKL